jgi:eukaryotic-like serine/threonine-protein kinase
MPDPLPPDQHEAHETKYKEADHIGAIAARESLSGADNTLDARISQSPPSIQSTLPTIGSAPPPPCHVVNVPPGYEVLAELGRGGMGIVYKARHIKLNRVVALKMILAGDRASSRERARFHAEAEAIAAVRHPFIVALLEYGEHLEQPFFTLEFMPNGSLAPRLQGIPQPAAAAARLVEQLAHAIHFAHTRGIVHRDLKPANVLLAEDGTPKITDFGLARRGESNMGMTASGEILGTPSYMAPEQAGGGTKHAGPAADVYALGAILYECLTGRPPFRAATIMETVLQVLHQEPVTVRLLQPQTPVDLATICHKCLQKEPHKRYATALELAEDCAAFRAGRPIRARPVGAFSRGWRWCQRNRALAGALTLGVVSLLLGAILSLAFAIRAETARQSEKQHAESEAVAKGDAEHARRDAQHQLVDLCGASGAAAGREGDHALALLWFARAVQLSQEDPQQEDLNRIRMANWLREVCLPEGTLAVPGFRQNQDHFRQFQFSPDGHYLLVVASAGGCRVWDRREGRLVSLPEGAANCMAAAWQPRSNLLAIAENSDHVRFLAAPDFRPVDEIAAGTKVSVLAFSGNGKRLALGGPEGARVWDRENKAFLTPLLPHGSEVLSLAFSSTADLLATATRDKKARVFPIPAETGEPLFPSVPQINGDDGYSHRGPDAVSPRFSANDRVLLTMEPLKPSGAILRRRSVRDGKLLSDMAIDPNGEGASFAVSETLELIAALGGSKGNVLSARTGHILAPIPESPPWMWGEHAIFSANGQMLVTCGHDTRARFWEVGDRLDDKLLEAHPPIYHPMMAVRVSLTADGRHLAVALWDGSVYLWRLPSGPPVAYRVPVEGTTVPVLSPDKRFVLPRGVSFREGSQLRTRVYDAETGRPVGPELSPGGILLDADFSPDGKLVATACSTGLTPAERQSRLFAPDGKGGNVQIWDWKTGQRLVGPIPTPGEPRGLAFRPNGSMLAVVCADYRILLVNPKTGVIPRQLDPGLRTRPKNANQWLSNGEARFSPDGRFLITWEMTTHIHVWDPDSGRLLHTLPHNQRIGQVAFSLVDPELLATSGWDSEARIWNLRTGKLVAPVKHPRWATPLQFSPDGQELISGADDGLLRVWDWHAGKLKDGWPFHSAPLWDFRFTADRRWLVTAAGGEMQVINWPAKTPVSPRWNWESKGHLNLVIEIPAGDRRAIVGGFSQPLVGYDIEAMRTPTTDRAEDLVALAELAASRRILNEGNVVPLNTAEWAERWEKVRHSDIAALKRSVDADHEESRAQ